MSDVLWVGEAFGSAGAWRWNLKTNVVEWTPGLYAIYGVTPEDFTPTMEAFAEFVHPDDREILEDVIRRIAAGEDAVKLAFRITRRDGSVRVIESVGEVVEYADDGSSLVMAGANRDVTEHWQAEEERAAAETALREREARLDLLNEANMLLLASNDPESVIQPIAEKVMRHLQADVFFNYVLDEGSQRLRLNACGGVSPRVAKMIERLELGQAICGCVARDGERIIFDDVQNNGDPRADLVRRMGVRSYVCHPIRTASATVGTLSFGTKSKDRFTDDEIDLMHAITAQVSVAVEKARLFESQRTRRHRIEALHDVIEVAIASMDMRDASQRILDHLSGHVDFDLSSIWLGQGDSLERIASVGYPPGYPTSVSLSDPLDAVHVFKSGDRVLVNDPTNPAVLAITSRFGLDLHSYLVLPLKARGHTIGTLNLLWTRQRELNEFDIAFFDSVADEVGVVLENLRMYEAERNIAETLQEMLVVLPFQLPGVEFSRAYESATAEVGRVGGDFVDIFEVGPDLVGIAIGDVSGKGVDAAVITSLVRNTVRAHSLDGLAPADVFGKTNKVMRRFTEVDVFVTMFFGVLNTQDGLLRWVSAAHPPVFVVNKGEVIEELTGNAPVVGAFDDVHFREARTVLRPQDRLVLYTDGVSEARSQTESKFFDLVGIKLALSKYAKTKTTQLASAIMKDVVDFSDGVLRDDAAILVVEPTGLS
jgi:PAS domain S-box-containing protein